MTLEKAPAVSPLFGIHIIDKDDLFPRGFTEEELNRAYADLALTAHDYDLLMESADIEEVSDYYNPGTEPVSPEFIFEAIVIDKFSRTEHRMKAVVRILNKHFAGSELKALSPIVEEPKKTGSFAYVTVQLPFSDGQVVSVIFHSPEGDKKKITATDTIIAFRWLLNKRDITHLVAPEDGSEVSLETIGKRVTQLVERNSARFERTQKEAAAERKELEEARENVKKAEVKEQELMDSIAEMDNTVATVDAKLSNTLALLEKQKTINADLRVQIDALRKSAEHDEKGKGGADRGTEARKAQLQTPQPTGTQGGTSTTETAARPAFVNTLDALLRGDYDNDLDKFDELLDEAAEQAEADEQFTAYEGQFNEVADHLTELYREKASEVM